ncbi:HA1F protein, partial [Passerina amoena]|nr:HA1F protein [Passerina amoena]
VLHSLRYLSVAVSEPSPGILQYMATGYLDGIPFTRYDSERGRVEPLTQWMKDGAEPEYWEGQTQIGVGNQHALWGWDTIPWVSVGTIPPGLHTVQWLKGCDLLSDGSVRGSYREGYDGRDLISFDLESGRLVAADNVGEISRRRWEKEEVPERWTNYLKHECPEWLQKYVRYGQEELERK